MIDRRRRRAPASIARPRAEGEQMTAPPASPPKLGRRTAWRVAAVSLLALAAVAAPSASASVVWDAGAERPADQEWASSCAEPSGTVTPPDTTSSRITRSSAVRAKGAYSYRFEVLDGDDCFGER